jgi:hypothetical protein
VAALTDSGDADWAEARQSLDDVTSIIVESFKTNISSRSQHCSRTSRRAAAVPLITTRLELLGNTIIFSQPLMDAEAGT